MRQALEQRAETDKMQDANHIVVRYPYPADCEILPQCLIEQVGILRYDTDMAMHLGHVADRATV